MTTTMIGTAWAEPYVGLPYRDGGRDRAGVDCFGLLRLVVAEAAGLELPAYGEVGATDLLAAARAMRAAADSAVWQAVDPAADRCFDAVLLKRPARPGGAGGRVACHVGVVIAPGRMLHVRRDTHSVIVPYRDGPALRPHWSVAGQLVGVFRHRSLA